MNPPIFFRQMFENLGSSIPHIRTGKVKALAVGSEKRNPFLPDVPTVARVLPGFVSLTRFGVAEPGYAYGIEPNDFLRAVPPELPDLSDRSKRTMPCRCARVRAETPRVV